MIYEMLDGPSADLWADLRGEVNDDWGSYAAQVLRYKGESTNIYMGISYDGSLNLFIPYEGGEEQTDLPFNFKGMTVELRKLRLDDGKTDPQLYLALSTHDSHERIFTLVTKEIAGLVVEDGFMPFQAVKNTIRRWRNFWSEKKEKELTHNQIIGLIGEVWFLKEVLIPSLGSKAVFRWSGPQGERHDFQGETSHIEVKVTEKLYPIFHISSLEQMLAPKDKQLYVAGLMLRHESAGSINLPDLIKGSELLLENDLDALEKFHECLAAVGYRLESEQDYAKLKFLVASAELYRVDENFPRLDPGSLNIPSGVSHIEYEIDLSNVECLIDSDFEEAIS